MFLFCTKKGSLPFSMETRFFCGISDDSYFKGMQVSWVVQVDVTDIVEVCVTARETPFFKDVSSEEHTLKIVWSVCGISDSTWLVSLYFQSVGSHPFPTEAFFEEQYRLFAFVSPPGRSQAGQALVPIQH